MSEKNRMDYEGDNNMSSDASQQEEGIVRISEDRMTATIELPKPEPGQEYTVEMIVGMLNENDVREGIFEEAIIQKRRLLLANRRSMVRTVILSIILIRILVLHLKFWRMVL